MDEGQGELNGISYYSSDWFDTQPYYMSSCDNGRCNSADNERKGAQMTYYLLTLSRNIVHRLVAKGLRYEHWCDEKRKWFTATKVSDKMYGSVYTTKDS